MRHESRSGTLWREGQGEGYEQRTAIYTCMKMKFSDFYMSHPHQNDQWQIFLIVIKITDQFFCLVIKKVAKG